MSKRLRIFKLVQTTAILFVAVLYCLGPLQPSLSHGFHKLEHAILNTNGDHGHDLAHEGNVSHSHDHKLLSFVNDLFQDDAQGNEQPVKEFKLDKHILQHYAVKNPHIQLVSENNFNYIFGAYSVSISNVLPPPENYFS